MATRIGRRLVVLIGSAVIQGFGAVQGRPDHGLLVPLTRLQTSSVHSALSGQQQSGQQELHWVQFSVE